MRDEYDFSGSKPNPYPQQLSRPVTIRLGVDVIDYFRTQAEETGIPYQTLINSYLKDCVRMERKLEMKWAV